MKYSTDEFIDKYCLAIKDRIPLDDFCNRVGMNRHAVLSRRRMLNKNHGLKFPKLMNERSNVDATQVGEWQRKLDESINNGK